MAAQTILELALENETIPLAKRVEHSMQGMTGKVKTYDYWGSDMDAITDPATGFTALMAASKNGNAITVEVLINRGADPNFRSERRGRTALHVAAKYGQLEIVNLLVDLGAQINLTDLAGGTALMHAAKAGYEHIVLTLLRRGAGINLTDRNGWAALHFAAKFGHKPVVEILVRAGAAIAIQDQKEGKNALMYAAQFGRRETLRFLLQEGLDPNSKSSIDGISALMLACREGHKGIVVDLIDAGADPSACSDNGWNALLFASAAGRRDTSAILLHRGHVDINQTDRRSGGISALTVASRSGQNSVVRLLLELGATIDSRDIAAGMTPLMHASKHDASGALTMLIEHNADINLRDKKGYTPLMHACINGSTEAIVELINNFADVNITDKESKSAFDHALAHGHRSLFLSALINVRAHAKVPFLSWLERECPKMSRGSDLGNPSVYLNAFLYGSNGLYAGLYFRNRQYDFELISGLVMLAAAFKRSAEADPECASDMLDKLEHVDLMIEECMRAQSMAADETVANSLLLHKPPLYRTELDILMLTPALQSGPLALYIDIKQSALLASIPIDLKIRKLFRTCLRRPPGYRAGMPPPSLLGCLSTSPWLRCRYWPMAVLVMSEFPKFIVLLLICTAVNEYRLLESCQLIVLFSVCMLFYELGEMEDKFNGDWPSILLDKAVLFKRRWHNFINHFNEDIWKRCDGLMFAIIVLWILDWMANGLPASIPVLSLLAIPTSFSLMRLIVAFNDGIGLRILLCFDAVWIVMQYFAIIAFSGLGVGVAMLILFRHNAIDTGFSTSAFTYVSLFESIYGTMHLSAVAETSRHAIGLFILSGFTVWVSSVIFSVIIADIASRLPGLETENKKKIAFWRAKLLQTCTLVNERSPLSMLPAPLNLASSSLYVLHYFLLNSSKLIPNRKHHLSLAGWISDLILGLLFLPVAYATAYFSTLRKSSYSNKVKLLCVIFSPVIIALNTIALLLTFGWLPAPVFLLSNPVKWSRMHRICYEDRRDCVIKVGLPEADYEELEEFDPLKQWRRKKNDDEDESAEVDGYEGYVDMDERNFHYYAMLLLYTAMKGFNHFSRFYMAVRDVMRGGASVAAAEAHRARSPTMGASRVQQRQSMHARKTTVGIENDNNDYDSMDSDNEDNMTYYDENGAPILEEGHELRDSDNKSINSLPFIGNNKPGSKANVDEYKDYQIPAYADDAFHYSVPQHLGVLYSLKERKRIFDVVIPEIVQNYDITQPGMMQPPDKTLVEFNVKKDLPAITDGQQEN